MGADPAKVTEAYVNCARDAGTILYGASWYHLFGRIERRVEIVPDVTAAAWEARERRVGERTSASWAGWSTALREGYPEHSTVTGHAPFVRRHAEDRVSSTYPSSA